MDTQVVHTRPLQRSGLKKPANYLSTPSEIVFAINIEEPICFKLTGDCYRGKAWADTDRKRRRRRLVSCPNVGPGHYHAVNSSSYNCANLTSILAIPVMAW